MKILWCLAMVVFYHMIRADSVLAWGPGIHTVTALSVLDDVRILMPAVARIISAFPLEFMYGCLSADFFVGKNSVARNSSLHNWKGGFKFLREAREDREAAYAYGFLSHLAADVPAHNYFITSLMVSYPNLAGAGHLYWEMKADYLVGPVYIKLARDVLRMDHKGCDERLKRMVGKKRSALKAKKKIFTQSVRFSDYVCDARDNFFNGKTVVDRAFIDSLAFMVEFSCRAVKDFLKNPHASPCLLYDPSGKKSLRLARRRAALATWTKARRLLPWANVGSSSPSHGNVPRGG